MIRKCGYKVVATTRADDLPLIINNKDKKIDLVLAEFRLIEMNKYELLEKIRSICEIPVVVSGAHVKDAIVECLCRGAKLCLEKPLMENDFKILWQFTVSRQRNFRSQLTSTHLRKIIQSPTLNLLELSLRKITITAKLKQKILINELGQGNKRKERADTDTGEHTEKNNGSDLGDQKKPKLLFADDLQNETLEAVPNIEEANNERKAPTEIKKNGESSEKKSPELVCMEEELQKWSAESFIDLTASVENESQDPLESVGDSVGPHEIPLSPPESSNNNVAAQLQMPTHEALDEEVMQDGLSLSDLEVDLQEGHGSNKELFDKIFTDLAKELKP
ncbi:putative two-component response regulator-like APRR8 [Arabidopsis thaliana]